MTSLSDSLSCRGIQDEQGRAAAFRGMGLGEGAGGPGARAGRGEAGHRARLPGGWGGCVCPAAVQKYGLKLMHARPVRQGIRTV